MKNFARSKCIILLVMIFFSCSSEESADNPQTDGGKEIVSLKTYEATDIMPTAVMVSSLIKSDTEKSLKSRGVCYNTTGNPTINDFKVVDSEVILGPASTLLIGLQQSTIYYAKPFVITNSGNVYYSNEIKFQTSKLTIIPTQFITYDPSSITSNSAILSAVIFKNGNLRWDNIRIGICISATNRNPNINDVAIYAKTEVTEPFKISVKNLNTKTIYYFRPFASSLDGSEIYYGDIKSFTTTN